MSLTADMRRIAATTFTTAGDLVRTGTLTRVVGVDYDVATRTVSPKIEEEPIRVVWSKVTTDDKKAAQRPTERRRGAIPADGLTMSPKVTDSVTVDGETYSIEGVETGAGELVYVIDAVKL